MQSVMCINLTAILLPSWHLFPDFTSKVNKNKTQTKNSRSPKKSPDFCHFCCCFFFKLCPTSKELFRRTPPRPPSVRGKVPKVCASRSNSTPQSLSDPTEPPDTDVPMKKHKPKGNYIMFKMVDFLSKSWDIPWNTGNFNDEKSLFKW